MALDVEGQGLDWRAWQIKGTGQLNNALIEETADEDDPMATLSVDVSLTEEVDDLQFHGQRHSSYKYILPLLGVSDHRLRERYGEKECSRAI